MTHDLVLCGGRVLDPSQHLDATTDIAFSDGKISEIGDNLTGADRVDVTGKLVVPGLIDLHTHVYWGGTSLSVEADAYARKAASTTLVDAGSAGPGNFPGFRAHVIERADVRILSYLHISFAGIYAFSPTIMAGESQDLRLMAAREAVAVAEANRDTVVGIKVRVGAKTSGINGIAPLDIALDVADRLGLPVMAHIDEAPPTYEDVVDRLRPCDILTHCFRPFPNSPVHSDGRVRAAVLRAKERGVLFDVGHGMGAFSWDTAHAMVAAGFWPDTISSDVHVLCIDGPAHDMPYTMTKFLALGMSLQDVITASTTAAAQAINRPDLGKLAAGGVGDASILTITDGPVELEDVLGKIVTHDQKLSAGGIVLGGKYFPS